MTVQEQSANLQGSADRQRKDSLTKRVASSVVLAPTTLIAAWLGDPFFSSLITFAAILMVFEWARMITGRDFTPLFYALAASGTIAMFCAAGGHYDAAFLFAAFGGVAAGAASKANNPSRTHWAVFGAAYIIAPSIALIWLRESVENGRALTFTLFGIVWLADIGAYFAGRFIGGPRVSRALSPEKTWSGIAGGVFMGGLAGAVATKWLYGEGGVATFIAIGASLGLASVLGDLAESAFKRIFGVKDSSGFIPGHGGVLDRLDGMIFATTAMTSVIFMHMIIGRLQG